MSIVRVHLLPSLIEPELLRGAAVVVIDVLRATTTIAGALAAGARGVIPCAEVDDARRIAGRFAPGESLLGGERGGLPIEGFDLGNSPCEYTPDRVEGKTVVFTTTNGTQALMRCRQAARVLTAGFVNAGAVVRSVRAASDSAETPWRIHLLCAGTRGMITREDVLLAGFLVQELARAESVPVAEWTRADDSTRLAWETWSAACALQGVREGVLAADQLAQELRESQGGRNLAAIGLAADLVDAAQIDCCSCVPELDIPNWILRNSH